MELKLSLRDTLQLAKAIKGGCLNIDKVDCLKRLAQGYNPPRLVKDSEMHYYLECIYKGWGIKPQTMARWIFRMAEKLPDDMKAKHKDVIEGGALYKELVKDAFVGLVALKAVGYSMDATHKPTFEWMDVEPPEFV